MLPMKNEIDFPNWINEELEKRDWKQADLCRATGLPTATVARVCSGTRNAGKDTCRKIAKALKLPERQVFEAAGIYLPPESHPQDVLTAEIAHLASLLDPDDKEDLIQYARHRLAVAEKRKTYNVSPDTSPRNASS